MAYIDLKKSRAIARNAFIIILAVGLAEIFVAYFSSSVALLADGVHSIGTSLIFLIVWVGLRLAGRSPNGTFHFGYYRAETLGSLIAAFALSIFGGLILFEAYNAWIMQTAIVNAEVAIAVAGGSAITVFLVSMQVGKASRDFKSTSLKTGGLSGVLDVLSSIGVVLAIIISKYFGILHSDAVAGVLIAAAIFVGAYSIFKESSIVLLDACQCGDVVSGIGEMAKSVKGVKEVHSIRIRKLGPYLTGDMHVVVSSDMLVRDADKIATEIEEKIKKGFADTLEFKIRIESDEAHDKHSQEFTAKTN